eukprot:Skav219303  [mRNA]  locus=scaffold2157:552979:555963:- [translate_table: standard]
MNPGSQKHPENCQPCRQYKQGKPGSCEHGSQCDFCHHEHRKHRSQRGRHNLQKEEYQEQKNSLPDTLTKNIDKMYHETHEQFQQIKKLLSGVQEDDRRALETRLLLEINEIGKYAQEIRPDNARLRRTPEPGPVRQVDLQSRCKWWTCCLHLMIRKMFEDTKLPEQTKRDRIKQSVEECLDRLKTVTERLQLWCERDKEWLSKIDFHVDLRSKIHALSFEERLKTKKFGHDSQEESCKQVCFYLSRLKDPNDETMIQQMSAAESLKQLVKLVQEEFAGKIRLQKEIADMATMSRSRFQPNQNQVCSDVPRCSMNPGSQKHPENCQPCRQYKQGKPGSCEHGSQCDFCHHEHRKHRSQRGRHNLQKKEYQEQKNSLPDFLTENIDKMYHETHEQFQQIKKLLSGVQEDDRRALETRLLLEINEIGKYAQEIRPDNARLRRTSEPGPVRQVDLQSRCKWLAGSLHLMIRKMFEDTKSPAQTNPNRIKQSVEECLDRLKTVTEQLRLWCERDKEWLSKIDFHVDLRSKIHALSFEERLKAKNFGCDSQDEFCKQFCLDWSRLKDPNDNETMIQQMTAADSLKQLVKLVQEELAGQVDRVLRALGQEG